MRMVFPAFLITILGSACATDSPSAGSVEQELYLADCPLDVETVALDPISPAGTFDTAARTGGDDHLAPLTAELATATSSHCTCRSHCDKGPRVIATCER